MLQGVAAKGLTDDRWTALSTSQIDFEASLGSDHPLNIGLNSFLNAPKLPDQGAAEAGKFGIGCEMQGMTVMQTQLARTRGTCYADWCSLFAKYAGRVPLEVQTYSPTVPAG